MGLRFAPEVQAYVRTLAPAVKRDSRDALSFVQEDPRHPKLDIKRLRKEATHAFFRIRVRDYRVIYSPIGPHVYVGRIQHRSDGYDWVERLDPDGAMH